jgi:hypothetical protein
MIPFDELDAVLTISLLAIIAAIWLWFRFKHRRWVRAVAALVGILSALAFAGSYYVATHLYIDPPPD